MPLEEREKETFDKRLPLMSPFETFKTRFTLSKDAPVGWTLGVDVSKWNGHINWSVMKAKGVKFAIMKGTDIGSDTHVGFLDTRIDEYYHGAKENGILNSSYCWLDPGADPVYQAKYYLDKCYSKYPTDLPPALDFEDGNVITWNDMLWKAQVWLETVEKETGRKPLVYTGWGYMAHFDKNKAGFLSRYPLWTAHYVAREYPTFSPVWEDWIIWQYSSSGHYPWYIRKDPLGGSGKEYGCDSYSLDMNWFKGDYNKLLEFCETSEVPNPQPPEEHDTVLFEAKCIVGGLNIRTGIGTAYPVVGILRYGNIVNVYEVKSGWFRVGEDRWCSGNETYMQKIQEEPPIPIPIPEPEPEPGEHLFKAICTASVLNVRSGPSTSYPVVSSIKLSEIVKVFEVKNGWYRIGTDKWATESYLKKITPAPENDYPPASENVLYHPMDEDLVYYTQKFGENPGIYPTSKGHNGLDWGTNYRPGYNIYATQDGIVTFSKDVKQKVNYGRHIRIHHKNKINGSEYTSFYGHLSARFVEEGESVKARQLIGLSGGATNDPYSGYSTGPHLHFEIRLDDVSKAPQVPGGFVYGAIDPEPLLVSHDFNDKDIPVLFEAECIVPVLNKRYGPSTNFGTVGVLKKGDVVKVYQIQNQWFKIDPRLSIWVSGNSEYMKKI